MILKFVPDWINKLGKHGQKWVFPTVHVVYDFMYCFFIVYMTTYYLFFKLIFIWIILSLSWLFKHVLLWLWKVFVFNSIILKLCFNFIFLLCNKYWHFIELTNPLQFIHESRFGRPWRNVMFNEWNIFSFCFVFLYQYSTRLSCLNQCDLMSWVKRNLKIIKK